MGWKIKLPKIPEPPKVKFLDNKAPPAFQMRHDVINSINEGDWNKARHQAQMHYDPAYKYIWSDLDPNKKGPAAPSPGEDPNVTALRDRLFGGANDFSKELPGLQQDASNQIQREGDLIQDEGLKSTRQNFNRRGLLYSGLREAGEQGVRAKVAGEMASQKAQSNKDLMKMAQAKYQTAAQAGLQGYQDAVNREAEIAGINLQNQVARAQAMQALGQTVGQGAGAYYGSRQNQQQPQAQAPYTGDYNYNPNRMYA